MSKVKTIMKQLWNCLSLTKGLVIMLGHVITNVLSVCLYIVVIICICEIFQQMSPDEWDSTTAMIFFRLLNSRKVNWCNISIISEKKKLQESGREVNKYAWRIIWATTQNKNNMFRGTRVVIRGNIVRIIWKCILITNMIPWKKKWH